MISDTKKYEMPNTRAGLDGRPRSCCHCWNLAGQAPVFRHADTAWVRNSSVKLLIRRIRNGPYPGKYPPVGFRTPPRSITSGSPDPTGLLRDPIVIAPEGELDLATLGEFRVQLFQTAREQTDPVLVDLTNVSFIDSSALTALLELQNQFRRTKRQLAVVAPPGSAVAVVLGLTGLRDRLPTYETRQAALES